MNKLRIKSWIIFHIIILKEVQFMKPLIILHRSGSHLEKFQMLIQKAESRNSDLPIQAQFQLTK